MFEILEKQLISIFEEVDDFITNASNFSAILYSSLSDVNWVGFYMMSRGNLLLSTFHGKNACIKIPVGNGVCGTSAKIRKTLIVDNVHQFPGHIACDESSNSEIVIPIILDNVLYGILDIDSTAFNRFSEKDKIGLEGLLTILVNNSNMTKIYKYYND